MDEGASALRVPHMSAIAATILAPCASEAGLLRICLRSCGNSISLREDYYHTSRHSCARPFTRDNQQRSTTYIPPGTFLADDERHR